MDKIPQSNQQPRLYEDNCFHQQPNTHNIILTNHHLPIIDAIDLLLANQDFIHVDRIAPFHVFIYVLKGEIYVTEDEQDYTIHSGEFLFLKAGIHHYGKTKIKAGTKWIYLHFYLPDYSNTAIPVFSDSNANSAIHFTGAPTCCFPLPKMLAGLKKSSFEQHLLELNQYCHSNHSDIRLHANAMFYELLLSTYTIEHQMEDSPKLYDSIREFLEQHLSTNFHAKDLEDTLHLTYKYMEHVFKSNIGTSILKYHTNLRMQKAASLLRSTSNTITEISCQLGFNDSLYFSRCFRNYMGYSPREYRALQLLK